MKPIPYFAAALCSLQLLPVAVGAESAASKANTAKLTALGCEMGRAYAHQDFATLDRLTAEDYTQTDTRGVVVGSRDQYLEYLRQRFAEFARNGASKFSVDCDNIEVRLYGDAAVVTGRWTYTAQRPEGDESRRSRWTSVWTRYTDG